MRNYVHKVGHYGCQQLSEVLVTTVACPGAAWPAVVPAAVCDASGSAAMSCFAAAITCIIVS